MIMSRTFIRRQGYDDRLARKQARIAWTVAVLVILTAAAFAKSLGPSLLGPDIHAEFQVPQSR